jgi:hypothetical protein
MIMNHNMMKATIHTHIHTHIPIHTHIIIKIYSNNDKKNDITI